MPFTAISMIQPWAWLMLRPDVTGAEARAELRASGRMKDVENRLWRSSQRGWVLLHASGTRLPRASVKSKKGDWDSAALFAAKLGVEVPLQGGLPYGSVVGAIRIDGCESYMKSRWFTGPWGYVIGAAVPFAQPVPCLGTLKFFPLPPEGGGVGGELLREELATELRAAGLEKEFGIEV